MVKNIIFSIRTAKLIHIF